MEKGNIIDFTAYSDEPTNVFQLEPVKPMVANGISPELQEAIDQLILRLKEANPITQR
jgi:hypothetical protein